MAGTSAPLEGRHILLGISGGIAAYKSPMLLRLLVKAGAEVACAMTPNAQRFVTPLTLETLSGHPVYTDLFDRSNTHSTEHIALKDWGDALVVAPATANVIGKMACGIADDALTTLLLSFRKTTFVCPAMNTQMLESPVLQRNLESLRQMGVHIVDSTPGALACGAVGDGRMAEPEVIAERLIAALAQPQPLTGRRILITAGPTYEKIDAVRFVGNYSSGKMGFALAEELARRGAAVTLVAGPTHLSTVHPRIERIDVESAREMYEAATQAFPQCDAAILSAAVADFRPDHAAATKIKKQSGQDELTLHLVQNPDILAALGQMKQPHQRLVGFALETDHEVENAEQKLERKNLDFIVLNSLRDAGAGFGHDTNKVTLIDRSGKHEPGTLKSKQAVASDIADKLITILT